jgi:hypothetical protein
MDALAGLYAAGGLEPDERREVDAHAGSCAPCAALLREARDFDRWARGAVAPDAPPADLEDRIVSRLFPKAASRKERRPRPGLRRALKALGGLAAAAALVVLGAGFTDTAMSASLKSLATGEADFSADFRANDRSDNSRSNVRARLLARSGVADAEARAYIPSINERKNQLGPGFTTNEGAALKNFSDDFGRLRGVTVVPRRPEQQKPADLPKPDPKAVSELREIHKDVDKSVFSVQDAIEGADQEQIMRKLESFQEAHSELARDKKTLEESPGVDIQKGAGGQATPPPVQDNRKIIRNADLHLEVEGYDATYAKIGEIVAAERGFVAGANTQRLANGKIRATVTVRIPPERFEAALGRFRDLGTVRHQNITSQDVTKAYVDLQARLGAKESLVERLKKVLAEAKGSVKELMEVEVQMGKTLEEIEAIKGELKYYDNLVGLSTIILQISEKDLGQPFEYVQTLQSTIGLTTKEPDDVYAQAQRTITDAGGQVVDSRMNRQNDGSAQATVKGRVDAEKFPAVREALKTLGHVDADTVTQQKTARGGSAGAPKPDAPLRKEQAAIDLSIKTPPIEISRRGQVILETGTVEETYLAARKAVEEAGGKIVNGSSTGTTDGAQAALVAHVDAGKFAALVEKLKMMGKVKSAGVRHDVTGGTAERLVTEKGEIALDLVSPPRLIPEEKGLGKTIRDTFSGSVGGLLWSVEKLFVGLSLAGPWIALALVAWLLWRRWKRRARPAQPAA